MQAPKSCARVQQEGHTLIQLKGSRVLSERVVCVCKPCIPALNHTFLHFKLGYELDRELAYYNATLDELISSADAIV